MPDERAKRASTEYFATAAGIGVIGVAGAIVGAAVCPVCVVAAPAFAGLGVYELVRERRRARAERDPPEP